MIGKKNIIFGCFFFVFSAFLGGIMVNMIQTTVGDAQKTKQEEVGRIQNFKANDFEEDLQKLDAEKIAKANTDGLLAMNTWLNAWDGVSQIRNAHAHGNLESLLNIVVGILLAFLSVSKLWKQLISWSFLLGAICHGGALFLFNFAGQQWAYDFILKWGVGPILILLGLVLTGAAVVKGFNGKLADS